MNFLPDASLLSKWGSARQPFFALFSFEGQIAATTLPKTIADSGNSANSGILLADCALHFRGFGALPKFEPHSFAAVPPEQPAAIENQGYAAPAAEIHNTPPIRVIRAPDQQQVAAAIDGLQTEMRAGRSYLVNYCSQTDVELSETPAALFAWSTAPFTVWLENQFICFSPEAFITVVGDTIFTTPMKGTGRDREALLADAKEQAEHATVVDLLRNDLGQVATGVRIDDYRYVSRIERDSGPLYQTSTRISGTLPADWREHLGDWLPRLLPAGSISGAPKQETLRLIRQYETEPRGFFTGVAVLFDGENLQSAVLIRFLELTAEHVKFRSGAGLTIYSDAAAEYEEILSKVYIPL